MKSNGLPHDFPKHMKNLEGILNPYQFRDEIFKSGPNLLGSIEIDVQNLVREFGDDLRLVVPKALEHWTSILGVCGVGQYALQKFPIYAVGRVELSGEQDTRRLFVVTRVMKTMARDGNPSEDEVLSTLRQLGHANGDNVDRYVLISSDHDGDLSFSQVRYPLNILDKQIEFGQVKLTKDGKLIYAHSGKEFDFSIGKYVANGLQH